MSRVVDCALGSKPQGFFKLTVHQVVLDGEKISETYLAKAFQPFIFAFKQFSRSEICKWHFWEAKFFFRY
jgi:hypothetical protein